MTGRKSPEIPENRQPLNRAALKHLVAAGQRPEPQELYLLQLATWGLEKGLQIPGPWNRYRHDLQDSLYRLMGPKIDPRKVMNFLFSNPNLPSPQEARDNLLALLTETKDPQEAALQMMEWYARLKAATDPYYRLAETESAA